jgi:hypothetical protein
VLARPHARTTIKIGSKNNLYLHRHFTEHLVDAFRKPPWKSNLNHEFSSFLIRRLKRQHEQKSSPKITPHAGPKHRVRLNWRRLWCTEPMRGELLLREKQTRAGPSRRWSAYTKKTAELSRSLETQPDWALPLQENTGAESKSRTSEGLLTQNGKPSQTERPTRGSEQKNASRNSRLRAFLWRGDRPYR